MIGAIVPVMATLREKIAAERRVRELLESEGLPTPDIVEYGHACIRLLWTESKVALVIDIDEFAHDELGELDGLPAFPPEC